MKLKNQHTFTEILREPALVTQRNHESLNLDDRLSVQLSYQILSKWSEILTLRKMDQMKQIHQLNKSLNGSETDSHAENHILEQQLGDECLEQKKKDIIYQRYTEEMDMFYQTEQFKNVYDNVMRRILNEDERQFKLDIEDIIEEEMYQCTQKLHPMDHDKADGDDDALSIDKQADTDQNLSLIHI